MGSADIYVSGYGKTASEVFNDLVSESQYEDGHAYDTGKIGAASDFIMMPLDQKKCTKEAIQRWCDKALEETSKHGPLWCLELPRSYAKGYKRGVRRFLFVGWVPD